MPVLNRVRDELRAAGLVRGRRIGVDLPVAANAEHLVSALAEAGAELSAREPEVVIGEDGASLVESGTTISCADARCVRLVIDRYGTGQAAVNAVLDRTNLLIADKDVVVVGYGPLGKGVAASLRGLAARVTVCDADPFAALEAHHEGFDVRPLADACPTANLVIAAGGAVGDAAIAALRDGALVANAGSSPDAIDLAGLREQARETRMARDHVEEFVLPEGRSLFIIGGGGPVHASAGEGLSVEMTDLMLAAYALAAAYLLEHGASLEPRAHALPADIDERIARITLDALGLRVGQGAPA